MICPVVAYAPSAATKPSIAIQPLNFSASGVIVLRFVIGIELKETCVVKRFLVLSNDKFNKEN